MTMPTTLADWAHTCRQKAATLLENAHEWDTLGENESAAADREEAADWQALADLCDYAAHGTRGNKAATAAKRLVARLDRP